MQQPNLHTALEDIRREIPHIDRTASLDAAYEAVHRLVLGVFNLGLALETNPADMDTEARVRIKADGDALGARLPEITGYVARWLGRFYGEGGTNWLIASRVRSGLEFLRKIYAGTALGAGFDELGPDEFDDLDDLMRRRAVHDGGVREEDIPAGVPASHWWWRAPDQ